MADETASFPVWVGNLAPRIKESTLLDLFGKFGPVKNVTILRDENGVSKQCGFVSFCSYSVSKAAAIGLDGCDIFGQIIETRGPDELVTTRHAPAVQHNKESKVLLDCVHFVEKKNCPFKAEQCPYRHCLETQNSDKICEKWLKYECRDVKCPLRHPVINILKDNADRNVSRAMPQPRCPSHNAFKCNGECGDSECETHFMEVDDMVEHVNRSREKKAVPSGACSGCKAVFFSEEERKKHSCFQPKNLQTPFIPIYHPITAKSTCSCSHDNNGKKPTTICKSCGSCYEHSGDTLSTFDCSPRKTSYSGHKCPNSPSVWDGKHNADAEPIGVFWDIENCPVPKGKSAIDIVKKIREEFFTNKREAEFMCVCDISKEKKEVIEDLNKSQVTVVHINATSKNAADDKLRQSLRRFAQSYPPPATVILVSGDINFAAELSDLRHRHNLTVICLHNAQAQSALLTCAHESKRFDLFIADLAASCAHSKMAEDNNHQVELAITNLPVGKDIAQIKSRLKKLSDNCGGKVASVTGRRAVMKFPNYQCAARAKKRMENEDVFGSPIQVAFPMSKSASSPTKPVKVPHNVTKLEDTVDMISHGPQRVSKVMSFSKKSSTVHQYNEVYCDDNLEEFVCSPSHQAGKTIACNTETSYLNQQPYLSNTSGTYAVSWQSPYCQGVVPIPTQGVGYTFPLMGPHPLTASWLANLHNLSVLEQQKGGVDLAVCNLDDTVNRKELKKKLASVFREHCKVYSVVLHCGEGVPLRAFIKVPKLSDAQFTMTKVNNQRIFSTSVTVTLISEKEKELCFLATDTTSLLKGAQLFWMPLNKFLSFFYEKCSRPFDMNVLTIIPDVVSIAGKPGCEAICLSTPDLHTIPILIVDLKDFQQDVHLLLKDYKGYLLLCNFAACYWLKFDRQIEVDEAGVRLCDALEGVVNVSIVEDGGKEVIRWAKEGIINGGVFNKLEEFSTELQDLLKTQTHYKLPLSQLISSYQKWFKKKTPFDPVTYGFSSVKDLLEALPTIVMVKEDGVERFVVLTQKLKLSIFETELKTLLQSQREYCLVLSHFVSVYQRCFNRKCYIQDYGVDKLMELIDKMSHIVKVKCDGNERMICLIESDGLKRKADPVAIETITSKLQQLFTCNKQLPVAMVKTKYFEEYGRHLNITKTGFASLENLITSVVPDAKIIDMKGTKMVCVSCKDTSVKDLVELVSQQDGGFISLRRLPLLYRKHFNKKFPLTINKLQELVETTNKELQILGADNDQILCYSNTSSQDRKGHGFKKLASDVHNMLIKFPGCRMSRAALSAIYHRQRGIGTLSNIGLSSLDGLLETMSDSIEVTGTGDFASVCLKHDYVVRCLARDVITILTSHIGKTVQVSNIPKLYEKAFGRPLSTQHYGFVSVNDMLDAMCSVVRVIGEKKNRVCLSPLQLFAIETKQLLNHLGGCVSLNRFAPCFQQYYNRPCKASDYGFSRLSEVLAVVPNIAEVRGKGVEKMVIMITDGEVLLDFIGFEQNTAFNPHNQRRDSKRESPSITYEGSDTESVIIEEELDDLKDSLACNAELKDLIVLSGNEEPSTTKRLPSDWMMAPVPKTLPEPGLYPEQDQRPLKSQQSQEYEDLITFKEFELGVSHAGLENPKHPVQKDKHKDRSYTSDDMEVLMANQMAQKHNSSLVCSSFRERKTDCSIPSGSLVKSTADRLLPVSPGMHDLSDVEAEILNRNKMENAGGSSSNRKIQSKPKPVLAPFPSKEATPSKKGTPVKLAVKFSMTP